MVEYTYDYAETTLLSTMGGIDKDKKNIIHFIGQQNERIKNAAQVQEMHPNRRQPWVFSVGRAAICSLSGGCQGRESHTYDINRCIWGEDILWRAKGETQEKQVKKYHVSIWCGMHM